MFERDGWSEVCGWVVGEEEEKKKLVVWCGWYLVQLFS